MARRLIFKEGGLTGSVPSGFRAIGFNGLTFSQLSSAGSLSDVGGSGGSSSGLTKFVEAQSTASPNATVYVNSLSATSSVTNTDFAIIPKGTGAFTLAIPDSTATGGNKRGTYAIDLQASRSFATSVASGNNSIVIGVDNRAAGSGSVAIGASSRADGINAVAIGNGAQSTNNECFVLGNGSVSSGAFGSVALGRSNTASGDGTITAGFNNTASGSRSVSLGESNIASGFNAVSLGNGNSNAGIYASVALGWQNTISSGGSVAFAVGQQNGITGQGMAIGYQNTVSNGFAIGTTNNASSGYAIGQSNTANGSGGVTLGVQSSQFGIRGRHTMASGQMSTVGDSQKSTFILQIRTTNATPSNLITWYGQSITPYVINQIVLQDNNTIGFKGVVVAKQSGSTNSAMFEIKGLITRGSGAGTTSLVYSEITTVSNSPGWGGPTFSANTGYGLLEVQAIGASSTNIQWTASIETTEVIYS